MRSPLHDTCPCTPRPTSVTAPLATSTTHSRPNPCSLRVKATRSPSGDSGERALPHRPRRFGVLERLGDERRVVVPEVQPSGVVAHADARAVGHVAHLLDRARTAELVVDLAVERDALHPRGVPRHVGNVPRLPHQRRAARRDVRIEHEVGRPVVEPLRRTVAVERPTPHLGLVDDGDHERAVGARRPAPRRRGPAPTAEHAVRRPARHRLQPQVAVAGGVDDRARIGRPGEAAAAEAAPDRGLRRRREDPLRAAGERHRDDRRRRLPSHRERQRDAIRRRAAARPDRARRGTSRW